MSEKTERLVLRISANLKGELEALASARGVPVSYLVRHAVRDLMLRVEPIPVSGRDAVPDDATVQLVRELCNLVAEVNHSSRKPPPSLSDEDAII